MPKFMKECEKLFRTKNLYELLGLPVENPSQIKQSEIKKAYYKCSLVYHPDRAEKSDEEIATKKFQILSKAYSILSDKDKRAEYDETGVVDDEDNFKDDDNDWLGYWRLLFKKVTVEDIKKFEAKYKNSEEEYDDLKAAYTRYEGDMDQIMHSVLCSTYEDEERFTRMLREMIEKKEVPKFSAFLKENKAKKTARKRKALKEAREAEEYAKELTGGSRDHLDEDDLKKMICRRVADREEKMNSFLDGLTAKYGGGSGSTAASKRKGGKK